MTVTLPPSSRTPIIQTGAIVVNRNLCRDHFRMTLRVPAFGDARPGQFVHLCPLPANSDSYRLDDDPWANSHAGWWSELKEPLLRRAFSVANVVRHAEGVHVDVMYRVVGTSTRWLASLNRGDAISVMGPLGREFPVSPVKQEAWLVAGGVGLPPLLWLASALREKGRRAVAFCGAQSRDLLALDLHGDAPATDARCAKRSAREFADVSTPVVISTDDGSLGYKGHIGAALSAYAQANPPQSQNLVAYTCGPERMMRYVAEFCSARDIECYVCVERNMACGTGMCQSCIVPVHDPADAAGWRYRLCCTEGPVFDAKTVRWE